MVARLINPNVEAIKIQKARIIITPGRKASFTQEGSAETSYFE